MLEVGGGCVGPRQPDKAEIALNFLAAPPCGMALPHAACSQAGDVFVIKRALRTLFLLDAALDARS